MSEATERINANLKKSQLIARELAALTYAYDQARTEERIIIKSSALALLKQIYMLNEAIPRFLQEIAVAEAIAKEKPRYERISTATGLVYIGKENKKQFIEELGIEKSMLKKLKIKKISVKEIEAKPSFLASLSNKIFYNMSSAFSKSSFFRVIEKDLRKANMPCMLRSYISIVFFLTCIVFVIALALVFVLSNSLASLIRNLAIAIVLAAITFFLSVTYPASVVGANRKKIEAELPFAISHMAAIASSNIDLSKIFSIIAISEYKAFAAEAKKIVNQVNIQGYNLTTALRNTAKTTSSRKLAELLNGMATTITMGGNLALYLNEKAKSALLDYRLSRERYATTLSLYSDIYTALLIAAPLIFMLILVIISILGSSFLGMPASLVANLGIAVIAMLNIIFLIFLHLTQPPV